MPRSAKKTAGSSRGGTSTRRSTRSGKVTSSVGSPGSASDSETLASLRTRVRAEAAATAAASSSVPAEGVVAATSPKDGSRVGVGEKGPPGDPPEVLLPAAADGWTGGATEPRPEVAAVLDLSAEPDEAELDETAAPDRTTVADDESVADVATEEDEGSLVAEASRSPVGSSDDLFEEVSLPPGLTADTTVAADSHGASRWDPTGDLRAGWSEVDAFCSSSPGSEGHCSAPPHREERDGSVFFDSSWQLVTRFPQLLA